jgi:ubiquinone/menaquinone biosynthesis C-methylase UbiE
MGISFDEAARAWDTKSDRVVMAEKFAFEINQLIKGKDYKTALEYGCGTANVSFFLKDNFEKISLADSSQGMLDEVQKKIEQNFIKHFTPILLNLEKESYNVKFDVIYTLMTLHHVADIEKFIGDFAKMLLPGGMLIIADLEKEDGDFHRFPENQEVHFGFEKNKLELILTDNKLVMNEYRVFYNIERTHTGESKIYTLFILSASNN